MSAQDIFEAMNQRHPNSGLKLRDIEAFLANSANVKAMAGMDAAKAADYIYTVLLTSQSSW